MPLARPFSSVNAPSVAVVGAGAAGLMAALFAARAGAAVLLVERTRQGGKKIVASGGGRCNVLPSEASPAQFVTESSPNTLRRMLLSWPLEAQRRFFEDDIGLALSIEPETGKLFPTSNRAQDVRDKLVEACRRAGVSFLFDTRVMGLQHAGGDGWHLTLADGKALPAKAVVLATGGLSVPNTGSDGDGLRFCVALGHTLQPTYPALTPLTAQPTPHADLAGISLSARIVAPLKKGRFERMGGFLFTHRGYSGPAVLDVSHLAVQSRLRGEGRQPLFVQWSGWDAEAWDAALRADGPGTVGVLLRRHLPTRLADALMAEAGIAADTIRAHLRRDERTRLVERLARYPLPWTSDEGYKKAEVTGGGVALGEVDPRTHESRRHAGLFLCGELLDAFGPIGGYNFMWAWSTGRAAGLGAGAYVAQQYPA